MIAPYQVPYGLREFSTALRGLTKPFPDVGRAWLPVFHGQGADAFPTNQGREAQYALLRALPLDAGARVGVPVFTHPVVWQTIAAAGMQPVFLDTDPVTLGLNLADLRRKRDRLDCLILVHTFGYPADFDAVATIMNGKPVLEDCAHALGSTYRGRPLGSLGDGSFFTFLFSKSLRAGGGGCAMVKDPDVGRRVEKLLHEGPEETFVRGFLHGIANLLLSMAYRKPFYSLLTLFTSNRQYRRVANSLRYRVSPSLSMRRSDWGIVASRLQAWNADSEKHSAFWLEVRAQLPEGWRIPPEPQWGEWNHWLLPLCPPSQEAAIAGIAKLRSRGVGARLIYLYSSEAARSYGYIGDCPEAERLSRLVFLLPSHGGLTTSERQHIVACVRLLDPLNDLSHNRRQKGIPSSVAPPPASVVVPLGQPAKLESQAARNLEQSQSAWRMRFNVSWNLMGNLVYALGQWLQLIILAHMGGPVAVGTYAFALALTGPVMMFASLCLRFVQASDSRGGYTFREYLSLRGATTVAAILVIVTIAWGTGVGRSAWAVLLPVSAMRAADALSDIYYGLWQQHERMSVIAWGLVLNSASSVALMSMASILGGGVPGAAVATALGSCAAFLFIRLRTAADRELRCAIAPGSRPASWRRVLQLSREAFPLGFTILLSSLQQNVPRIFVRCYAGAAELGVFAAASQLTTAADIFGGALAGGAAPRLGVLSAGGSTGPFRNLTRKLALAGALLGSAGVVLSALAGRWFLVLLYRPEFASGAHMLIVLSAAAGMGLVASLLGYSLTSARVITIQPLLLTVTLTVLVVCCSAVVPYRGGEGAAWALLVATSVHALVSWVALRHFVWKPGESRGLHETRAA